MQEVWKARDKFCESQQPRIEALWRFVQEQRARRRQVYLNLNALAVDGLVCDYYFRQPVLPEGLQGLTMLCCQAWGFCGHACGHTSEALLRCAIKL